MEEVYAKAGHNTVYASRDFDVPRGALIGFHIKQGDKSLVPYDRSNCYNIDSYQSYDGIDPVIGKRHSLKRESYVCYKYSIAIMVAMAGKSS